MKEFSHENQLIHETSPYLLQHAHNPVNWYPWNKEAFELAKEQNKPVFVSIGYSTCHWCHRMAHDCFEDEEVAEILNRDFISIKVDREERPDIDQIYMNVCQMLTGSGGWPLNVFLTPEQLPFYAGTYFPKYSIGKQAGMLDILAYLTTVYHEQPDRVVQIGEGIKAGLIQQSAITKVEKTADITSKAYRILANNFDEQYGGFGNSPKFPNVSQLHYLMKYGALNSENQAFHLVEKTLDQLYRGGIYDHLGGGFSRYAVDEKWLVPHFEKMLYDQAQLLMIYAEGYQKWQKPLYKYVIEDTFNFLQREMLSKEGNYYSAIDADSEGREGAYYLWDLKDVPADLREHYGISGEPHLDGQYIFNLIDNADYEMAAKDFKEQRQQLHEIRQNRIFPHVDQKQLTGWNALLAAAFAKSGAAIQSEELLKQAQRLMQVLEQQHMVNGRLKMTANSEAFAFLDDYAYMLWAYNELYEATQVNEYLEKAREIAAYINENFTDGLGGFTASSSEHEQLIVNQRTAIDGALPPGNGILAVELYRLSRLLEDMVLEEIALQQLEVFSKDTMTYPTSSLTLLQLELHQLANGKDFKLEGNASEIVEQLQSEFRPFDLWKSKHKAEVAFSMEICQKFSCLAKINNVEEAKEKISLI